MGYLLTFIPAFLVILGNLKGGWYTLLEIIFAFVVYVVLDWTVPEDTSHPAEIGDKYADTLLVLHVLTNTASIGTLLYAIDQGYLSGIFLFFAILGTGVNSGQSGIIVAHELVHRKSRFMRFLGNWNLLQVLYIHWTIEHRYGHHKWVGSFKDPATARYGETVYFFILRTIPQQFISAFQIEKEHQIREGKNPYGPHNLVIWGVFIEILLLVGLYIYSPMIFYGFIAQAFIAIILLELVNYIEHYGLLRENDDPYAIELSWNTDVLSSRLFLFELTRHSDHHLKSFKKYQTLISYEDSVPKLPAGYWGMFYITLIPWWWRRMMHPLIPEHMLRKFTELTGKKTHLDLKITATAIS